MSEGMEWKKRRLDFLNNELSSKEAELRLAKNLIKCERARTTVKTLPKGGETMQLQKQVYEMQNITNEIDRLKFEIEEMEAELENKREVVACSSCNKDVSWLPADATHCPYCGTILT